MKLNKEFIAHISGDEAYLVSTAAATFSGMMQGNKTLGEILELLKTDTTEAEIVASMCDLFDVAEDVIARDVKRALSELRKIGALDE
jgi:hypothetical protein